MIVSAEPLDAWLVPRPWLALYGNWIRAGHSPLTEVRLLRCTMRVRAVRTPQAALCLAYATESSADMHIQDSAAPLRRHHAANFLQPICSRSCHGKYDLQAVVPDIEGAPEGHHACLPLGHMAVSIDGLLCFPGASVVEAPLFQRLREHITRAGVVAVADGVWVSLWSLLVLHHTVRTCIKCAFINLYELEAHTGSRHS